jgi:hypothetical protein
MAYFLTGDRAAPSQLPEALQFVDICSGLPLISTEIS